MPPRLGAVATAVPPHQIDRTQVAMVARQLFGAELDRLGPIYANAGIERRQSCVPLEWYLRPHGWKERLALFVEHALDLASRAILECLDNAGLRLDQVDAVVAVSTTGMCTPSLDALLMERLKLRRDVTRLPIFGLGCAGGVLGLARAAALAKAMPGANVVLVVVELCGLTFRPGDRSASNMVATALFGDGCAAAVVSTHIDGPSLTAWGEHTWPESLDIMGWQMEEDGFGVQFSRDIPPLITRHFRPALDGWMAAHSLERDEIDRFLCHPGGAKVITALEQALSLPQNSLALERDILRDYGNMSAATLLFVLERALSASLPRRTIATALGPGFTAGFLLLETP